MHKCIHALFHSCSAHTAVAPPQVSAHERRLLSLQRKEQAELSAEQQLVASLQLPVEDDD